MTKLVKVQLEICTGSLGDCLIAERGGADRVELNSALSLGGLTPSAGSVAQVLEQLTIPVIAMVRPRESGFCYSDEEFETLLADTRWLIEQGVSGVAFGILNEHCNVDVERCKRVIELVGDREAVFHRAFDLIPDSIQQTALDQLMALGVKRVMTSGGRPTAWQGRHAIAKLCLQAGERIEILAAGGIRSAHVLRLINETGVRQVHAGLGQPHSDASYRSGNSIQFSSSPPDDPSQYRQSCLKTIESMVETLANRK